MSSEPMTQRELDEIRARVEKELTHFHKTGSVANPLGAECIINLLDEVERLRAELESAKGDMWTTRCCQNCKHCPKDYPALRGACKDCDDEDKWEWRGPRAEKEAPNA